MQVGAPKKSDVDEAIIYENIKNILMKEIGILRDKPKRDSDDIIKLEKLTRVYATLKDDFREDIKHGVWDKNTSD
jgi:hypothetical protein